MGGINFSQFGKYENLARELTNTSKNDLTNTQKNSSTWNVMEGASLNKMRKVAEKLLESQEITVEQKLSIYKKLDQAILQKKVYYDSNKKGKIVDALRNKPFLSKFFNQPIAKADELRRNIASEDPVKNALAAEKKEQFYSNVKDATENNFSLQFTLEGLASAFKEDFVPSAKSKEFEPFMTDLLDKYKNLEDTLKSWDGKITGNLWDDNLKDGLTKLQELKFLFDARELKKNPLKITGLFKRAISSSLTIKDNPKAWASILSTLVMLKKEGVDINNFLKQFIYVKPGKEDPFWDSDDGRTIKELLEKIGG